jgi:hypothetical protein
MARYIDAIQWMADNDDTDWVEEYESGGPHGGSHPSVTACMIADLWDKTEQQVYTDLVKALQRNHKRNNK